MPIRRDHAITSPNLGLYLGMSPTAVPRRGMRDCLNIRLKMGDIVRDNLGWSTFPTGGTAVNLDSKPATLINTFEKRDGTKLLVLGNTTDLFYYDDDTGLSYLTPVYNTGTVAVTNASAVVTGTGTTWSTNLKAGDFIFIGADDETDPTVDWYEIDSVDSDTQVTLTVAYTGATSDPENYTARLTFTGDASHYFRTEVFYNGSELGGASATGDRWYATNGLDNVVAWDGTAAHCYVPDLGNIDTCADITRHKNQMVFVAPTLSGTFAKERIRTSNIGEPENTVSGTATELIVKDGSDALLAAVPLGEQLVLYAEKTIILAQFVGGSLVYAFRTAVTGYGPFSGRAIAAYPDFHDFTGDDLQYRFDGATIRAVNSHVWRDVMRRVTPERRVMMHCFFDESQGELLWSVPLTTDPDPTTATSPPQQAFVDHYLEDTGDSPEAHTRREIPALVYGSYERDGTLTWDQITEEWQNYNYRWSDKFFFAQFPQVLFGDEEGNIFILNGSTSKNGAGLTSFARFSRLTLGSVENKAVLRRIYPFMQQQPSSEAMVQVRVYTTDTKEGRATLETALSFPIAISTERHFVTPRISARYGEVEIRTEETTDYWAMNGYAVDTVPGSGR